MQTLPSIGSLCSNSQSGHLMQWRRMAADAANNIVAVSVRAKEVIQSHWYVKQMPSMICRRRQLCVSPVSRGMGIASHGADFLVCICPSMSSTGDPVAPGSATRSENNCWGGRKNVPPTRGTCGAGQEVSTSTQNKSHLKQPACTAF